MTIVPRIARSIRTADYGTLILELFVVVVGILLALAVDRWNQQRIEANETARIVERLKADTARNLAMFEESLPSMGGVLEDVKAVYRSLEAGSMTGEDPASVESGLARIDVVPGYPLVMAAYDELVATGRLRHLDDPELVDLLSAQRAEYEAAQGVVSYWRANIQGVSDVVDQHVDFYYTTPDLDELGMGVRFEFEELVGNRDLRNKVFDAVDIHGDWLRLQTSIYDLTKRIDERLSTH